MNRTFLTLPLTVSLLATAAAGALSACGGDDSGGTSAADVQATCKQFCEKEKTCNPDLASFLNCDDLCTPRSGGSGAGGGSSTSCDYGKLKAKYDECLNVECSALDVCAAEAASICGGDGPAGGSGGSSNPGAGGSSNPGAGGSDPVDTTTCAACDPAGACCVKVNTMAGQSTSGCEEFTKDKCEALPAEQKSAMITGCAAFISNPLCK